MDYSTFTLKPDNFFERNPVLNVPAPASSHCSPVAHADGHGHGPHADEAPASGAHSHGSGAHGHDGHGDGHHC